MKVNELAKKANLTPETVRYYTREGLISAFISPDNGYRVYDHRQLQRLLFIAKARQLGFCLKDIKSILAKVAEGQSPCPVAKRLLAEKIQTAEREAQTIKQKIAMMKSTLAEWQKETDVLPNEKIICPLIEGVKDDSK